MSMQHMSYVECDRCYRRGPLGDTGAEARILAERLGWDYRNWNKRLRDVCPDRKAGAPRIEQVTP